MPIAAIIAKRIFCSHGGLSPHLNDFDQIREIQRPTHISRERLLCDLLWSDPKKVSYISIYHVFEYTMCSQKVLSVNSVPQICELLHISGSERLEIDWKPKDIHEIRGRCCENFLHQTQHWFYITRPSGKYISLCYTQCNIILTQFT